MNEREGEPTPSLQEQTLALGVLLKQVAESDPAGVPSVHAASAFSSWVREAGPTSREPRYFEDVALNYGVADNTNKDLWELFGFLQNYIEIPEEDYEEAPRRTFIGLPLLSDNPGASQ